MSAPEHAAELVALAAPIRERAELLVSALEHELPRLRDAYAALTGGTGAFPGAELVPAELAELTDALTAAREELAEAQEYGARVSEQVNRVAGEKRTLELEVRGHLERIAELERDLDAATAPSDAPAPAAAEELAAARVERDAARVELEEARAVHAEELANAGRSLELEAAALRDALAGAVADRDQARAAYAAMGERPDAGVRVPADAPVTRVRRNKAIGSDAPFVALPAELVGAGDEFTVIRQGSRIVLVPFGEEPEPEPEPPEPPAADAPAPEGEAEEPAGAAPASGRGAQKAALDFAHVRDAAYAMKGPFNSTHILEWLEFPKTPSAAAQVSATLRELTAHGTLERTGGARGPGVRWLLVKPSPNGAPRRRPRGAPSLELVSSARPRTDRAVPGTGKPLKRTGSVNAKKLASSARRVKQAKG